MFVYFYHGKQALKGISRICENAGVEMSKASLAWILQHGGIDVVISGASSPEQIVENSEIIKLDNVRFLFW